MAVQRERSPGQRSIIVTADDFGRSPAINAAVIRAHREGVLTSASLMVAGDAADEAAALARAAPTLSVGLHVVVLGGRAVLPRRQIPHLAGADGCFSSDPLGAGLRYAFSGVACGWTDGTSAYTGRNAGGARQQMTYELPRHPLRSLIRRFDAFQRQRLGVYEYSDAPDCVLRIQLTHLHHALEPANFGWQPASL